MPTDTFWSNPRKLVPAQSIITLNSPGDLQPNPLSHIPGTSAGALPSAYTTSARIVYPLTFNFNDPARVAEYNTLVTTQLGQFSSWHSLYQAHYLSQRPPGAQFVSVPASLPANTRPDAYFILLADNRTVLNVMSMTLADYQKLSLEDRNRVEATPPFLNFVQTDLGLVRRNSATDTVPGAIGQLRALIDAPPAWPFLQMSFIDRQVFKDQLNLIERRYGTTNFVAVDGIRESIGELTERFRRASLFANVRPEVSTGTQFRQDGDEKREATLQSDVKGYAISSDNSETVRSGYQAFMRAEREILSAQLRREAVSRLNAPFDPKADVAQLIYQLQLLYQTEAEARGDGGTEEMAQLHRLLSDYAIIQRLVNETLKVYNPKDPEEKRRFMNLGAESNGNVDDGTGTQRTRDGGRYWIEYFWDDGRVDIRPPNASFFGFSPAYHWYMLAAGGIGDGVILAGDDREPLDFNRDGQTQGEVRVFFRPDEGSPIVLNGGLSAAEMRIVGMFSDDPWGSGPNARFQGHPIEILYGAERPLTKLSDHTTEGVGSLTLQRRDYWDKWSSQLAETVTILNQKNQLKQNEIENESKQGNRHFDLGTNALRKMNEMLMSIGRM